MNIHILLDVFLIALGWGLFFALGYIKASWDKMDSYDRQVEDMSLGYRQEIDRLRAKLHEEGDGWKI